MFVEGPFFALRLHSVVTILFLGSLYKLSNLFAYLHLHRLVALRTCTQQLHSVSDCCSNCRCSDAEWYAAVSQ